MSVPSTKRRRRPSKTSSTDKPTGRRTTSATKRKPRSSTRVARTPLQERQPFSAVSIDQPPDGYYYLELISQDMHAVKDIERELLLRTTLAERCYMQSKIPVYRIPETEAHKMKPWPFIQGQDKYAGCSLPANNKQKETYVFRNQFNHQYLLKGHFETLTRTQESTEQTFASKSQQKRITIQKTGSNPTNRRTRSRIRAEN